MHERDELIERLLGSRRGDIASQQPFALPLKQRQVDVATPARRYCRTNSSRSGRGCDVSLVRDRYSTGGSAVCSPRAVRGRRRPGAPVDRPRALSLAETLSGGAAPPDVTDAEAGT
jgi:hypothetical protein